MERDGTRPPKAAFVPFRSTNAGFLVCPSFFREWSHTLTLLQSMALGRLALWKPTSKAQTDRLGETVVSRLTAGLGHKSSLGAFWCLRKKLGFSS